jgi:hypothetical protein
MVSKETEGVLNIGFAYLETPERTLYDMLFTSKAWSGGEEKPTRFHIRSGGGRFGYLICRVVWRRTADPAPTRGVVGHFLMRPHAHAREILACIGGGHAQQVGQRQAELGDGAAP